MPTLLPMSVLRAVRGNVLDARNEPHQRKLQPPIEMDRWCDMCLFGERFLNGLFDDLLPLAGSLLDSAN